MYLEETEITLHANRFVGFDHPMTEVMDYCGPNPKKRRIYRQIQLGETGVETYGRLAMQVPPQ